MIRKALASSKEARLGSSWRPLQLVAAFLSETRVLRGILEWCITSVLLMPSTEGFWCCCAKRAQLKWVACLTWTVTYAELLYCSEETEVTSKCWSVILYGKGQVHWKPVLKEETCVDVCTCTGCLTTPSSGCTSCSFRQVETQHKPGMWGAGTGLGGWGPARHLVAIVLLSLGRDQRLCSATRSQRACSMVIVAI